MSVTHITASQTVTVKKDSEYYVVAIGPGGNGARGGNPVGTNSSFANSAHGGCGGGGGAGAFVFVGKITALSNTLIVTISHDQTALSGAMGLNLVRAGDGNQNESNTLDNANPGNSITMGNHIGSRGGGAGGPYGVRGQDAVKNIAGGIGSYGNGAEGVAGATTRGNQYHGTGGAGGGNSSETQPGLVPKGGAGAQTNGLSIDDQNIGIITAAEIAQRICGGNGANGSQPALNRITKTGIAGGAGGAGGGAWTDGENGNNGEPEQLLNTNGKGGEGGKGGLGCVWLKEIVQRIR